MKKIILITGSTDGIGKLAAINLAQEGHEIYLHGRNSEKLSQVIAEVKSLTKNEAVKGFVADLSDLVAVDQLAKQINDELTQIDILINNAGVFKSTKTHNNNGLDLRYVVNYLAPYLLTQKLMPLLQKGTATRIINLSSAAQASIQYEVLMGKKNQPNNATYAQSKLALTMWSFHLADVYPDIAIIPVNPGSLLNTNMVKEGYGYHRSSADKGANILHDLAVSKKYEGITKKYFDNDRGAFGTAHSDAYDKTKINQLIDVTDDILKIILNA